MQYSQVKDVDETKVISKAKLLVDWKCSRREVREK